MKTTKAKGYLLDDRDIEYSLPPEILKLLKRGREELREKKKEKERKRNEDNK